MKIYSTHRNKQNLQINTLKHDVMMNWQRIEHTKNRKQKNRSTKKVAGNSWINALSEKMQAIGEKLSEFFYPEVLE